jgi:uncharacterized protein with HEPN domain
MKDEVRKLLFDVVDSGDSIIDWTEGKTFADYETDRQFRRAVEREFEIIGEALARMRRDDPATANQIPELTRIISFRNRIIHGYDSVDDATVWGIVEAHLPALIAAARRLLEASH